MTDPIADMLSRITNAINVRAETVDMPYSKIKEEMARILQAEGYLQKVDTMKKMEKQFLRIALKYSAKKAVISCLQRVSKPGKRIYVNRRKLPKIHAGFGTALVSTSRGIMTDDTARAQNLGGEVLCYVW
jgi:small subunit ribosomal protein S8